MAKHILQTLIEAAELEPTAYRGRGPLVEPCLAVEGKLGMVMAQLVRAIPAVVGTTFDPGDDEPLEYEVENVCVDIGDALEGMRWDKAVGIVCFPDIPFTPEVGK